MKRTIGKLLNIRDNEGPRLLLLYSTLLLLSTGMVWGLSIVEAAFLENPNLGVDALPWFFVAKAVLSVPAVALYSAFVDRFSSDHMLIAISCIGLLGIFSGLVLLLVGLEVFALPILFLIIFVPMNELFFAQWYTYVNDLFDTRSAKRIIPVLGTSGMLAFVVAGLTIPFLSHWLSLAAIVALWFSMVLVAVVLLLVAPRFISEYRLSSQQEKDSLQKLADTTSDSFLHNISSGYRHVIQSPLLRWLASSALIVMALLTLLEYQTSHFLVTYFQTTENIASFTGSVLGISTLIMFPMQLFVISRVIARIGVGNANLIYPVGMLAITGGLVGKPSPPTAALSYFGSSTFFGTVGSAVNGLMYNAVPIRIKGRARAFIEGLIFPFGSLLGGGLLLLLPLLNLLWLVPFLLLILAALAIINAMILRRKYNEALIAMLKEDDFSFLLAQNTSSLRVTDPTTLNELRKRLEESTSDELTIFMASLISQVGGDEAVPVLTQAARNTTSSRVLSAIINILNAADVQAPMVRNLYVDFLTHPEPHVRQSALAGLEDVFGPNDLHYLSLAQGMLQDPDVHVRIQAIIPIIRSQVQEYQEPARVALEELLTSDLPSIRASGVRVLGQSSNQGYIHRLADFLTDTADEVRLEAAVAFEDLLKETLTVDIASLVSERMGAQLQDPIERVRLAALVVLGRINREDSFPVFLHALADPSVQIRTMAVETLVQVGKAWAERYVRLQALMKNSLSGENEHKLLHHQQERSLGRAVFYQLQGYLDSEQVQVQKMAAMVYSRINREQYGSLILKALNENLRTIYRTFGLLGGLMPFSDLKSVMVLQCALREENNALRDEMFYLLTALNKPEDVQIVHEALRHESAHVRANATEALEMMTSPQTVWLIEPLFNPDIALKDLQELGQDMWNLTYPDTAETMEYLMTSPESSWIRTMMTFAAGDIGVSLKGETNGAARSEPSPEQDDQTNAKRRDPLDALDKLASEKPAQSAGRARRKVKGDLLGALTGPTKDTAVVANASETPASPANDGVLKPTYQQVEAMIEQAQNDSHEEVRVAAQTALLRLAGQEWSNLVQRQEEGDMVLSTIERIIFLKGVLFFQGMTIEQLKALATVCEERFFPKDTRIFREGDAGGTLYVVVSGRVAIEQEKRKDYFARLSTIEAHSYFGEDSLFDNNPQSTTALAIQDTLMLLLRREPLIALARQHPDLSLELINVLSLRLRETNARIAELTRTRPRELHKLFDQFE